MRNFAFRWSSTFHRISDCSIIASATVPTASIYSTQRSTCASYPTISSIFCAYVYATNTTTAATTASCTANSRPCAGSIACSKYYARNCTKRKHSASSKCHGTSIDLFSFVCVFCAFRIHEFSFLIVEDSALILGLWFFLI